MNRPFLSVVAPCYNEHLVLPAFHERVSAVCSKLGQPDEIVLVNDGSRDQTWETMLGLAGLDPHVVLVKLSRNHGHQFALTAGLSVCAGERVLIIDADLQDPPELVTEMLAAMDARRVDVVYGQTRKRSGETRFKLLTASLFYRLIELLSDTPSPRDAGDFRLISRRALDVLQRMPERHRFIRGMVSWIGFRQEPLLYDRDPRLAGATKYPIRKMLLFATEAITSFSIRPLRLAIAASVGTALLGVILIVYSLTSWLLGSTVVGWTSLMAAMAVLSSMQFLILGIFGEYLGRLYDQSKGRPLFIIESVVHGSGLATAAEESPPRPITSVLQENCAVCHSSIPIEEPQFECSGAPQTEANRYITKEVGGIR